MAHIFPFLAVGGAAASSSVVPAAGIAGALGGVTATSTALSIPAALGAASTLTGAITSIVGGIGEARALQEQALFQDAEAKAAELEGRRQTVLQLEDLNRSLAQQIAATGASGIGFTGSPIEGIKASERRGLFNIELGKASSAAQVAAIRAQARMTRRAARQASVGGFLGAGAGLLSGGLAQKARIQQEQTILGL